MSKVNVVRNKLPRRKQRGIENLIKTFYAASGGEFNPEWRLKDYQKRAGKSSTNRGY